MRTTTVNVKVRLEICAETTEEVEEVLENMDYNFLEPLDSEASIEEMEIKEWEIVDDK